ncbi:MAG: DUF4214 domain-containing protein [Clostridia bacterium]|nr:DUF4214 domain-containing protein [Clostridia bacterium]
MKFKKVLATALTVTMCFSSLAFNAFADGTTGVKDFVTRCYKIALGREPDETGLQGWTDQLLSGDACGVSVAYGFVYSPEFQSAGYDNSTYVEKMYNMLLGRESDSAGKASWVEKLDNGENKETIFYGFANSQEFYNLCNEYGVFSGFYLPGEGMQKNAAINGFVDRLYTICLGRHGDQGGHNGWVTNLYNGTTTGSEAAYGFIFSPEFTNKNLSDKEYVSVLYATFLGRQPDEVGLSGWVDQLSSKNATRTDVFNGFANSIEFDAICGNYGIVKGTANYVDTSAPETDVAPTVTPVTTPEVEITPTTAPSDAFVFTFDGIEITIGKTTGRDIINDPNTDWNLDHNYWEAGEEPVFELLVRSKVYHLISEDWNTDESLWTNSTPMSTYEGIVDWYDAHFDNGALGFFVSVEDYDENIKPLDVVPWMIEIGDHYNYKNFSDHPECDVKGINLGTSYDDMINTLGEPFGHHEVPLNGITYWYYIDNCYLGFLIPTNKTNIYQISISTTDSVVTID